MPDGLQKYCGVSSKIGEVKLAWCQEGKLGHLPTIPAASTVRCNTICYKSFSKGGVYGATETGEAFREPADRHVGALDS